jgi:hypothetical protein
MVSVSDGWSGRKVLRDDTAMDSARHVFFPVHKIGFCLSRQGDVRDIMNFAYLPFVCGGCIGLPFFSFHLLSKIDLLNMFSVRVWTAFCEFDTGIFLSLFGMDTYKLYFIGNYLFLFFFRKSTSLFVMEREVIRKQVWNRKEGEAAYE